MKQPVACLTLASFLATNTGDVARKHVNDPELLSFIDIECYCWITVLAGLTPMMNAGMVFCDRHYGGINYPKGGVGRIAQALAGDPAALRTNSYSLSSLSSYACTGIARCLCAAIWDAAAVFRCSLQSCLRISILTRPASIEAVCYYVSLPHVGARLVVSQSIAMAFDAICDVAADGIEEQGSSIMYKANVRRILTEGQGDQLKAVGVQLADGRTFKGQVHTPALLSCLVLVSPIEFVPTPGRIPVAYLILYLPCAVCRTHQCQSLDAGCC